MKTLETFIEEIVDGEAIRAPLFSLVYDVEIKGRRGAVRHDLSSLIYSDFDARLSRHLRATRGASLPGIHIETSFVSDIPSAADLRTGGVALNLLDALVRIGEGALRDRRSVEIRMAVGGPEAAQDWAERDEDDRSGEDPSGARGEGADADERSGAEGRGACARIGASVVFDRDMLDAIRQTRRALETVGDPALCRVTGDLNGVAAFLPDDDDAVLFEADFRNATITFPDPKGDAPIRAPLAALDAATRDDAALSGRLRLVRDVLIRARKGAVDAFRKTAEREVSEFDRSLGRRDLSGFRQEIALDLVERLTLAFGEALRGLSPHARLLAYDWAHGDPSDAQSRDSERLVSAERPIAAE